MEPGAGPSTCSPLVAMVINFGLFGRVLYAKRTRPHMRTLRYVRQVTNRPSNSTAKHVYLQVLGTGGNELAPTVLLNTDSKKYLFNCSETTARLCEEQGIRTAWISNIFFTRCTWENTGGMLAVANTLCRLESKELSLHGPVGVQELFLASKACLGKRLSKLMNSPCDNNEPTVFTDSFLSVTKVELSPKPELRSQPLSGALAADGNQEALNRRDQSHSIRTPGASPLAAFVCRMASLPGKFDLVRAQELGVPNNELRRALVNGKPIVTPDGRTVHPHEVVGPPQVGPDFMVVECPHADFIPSVASHPSLQSSSVQPDVIVHMSPATVVMNVVFQTWMQSFGPGTTQLLVHKDFCPGEVVIRYSLKRHIPLHLLCPSMFHLPCTKTPALQSAPGENTVVANSLLKYHLRPTSLLGKIERSESLQPIVDDVKGCVKQLSSDKDLAAKLNIAFVEQQSTTGSEVVSVDIPDPVLPSEPAVTFLGTSSAITTRYRNGSGILLHSGDDSYVLLDCAEGTLGQIYRCFGSDLGDHVIRNLTFVFISHFHVDHHLGLLRILHRRSQLLENHDGGQLILSSVPVLRWLLLYNRNCEKIAYRPLSSQLFVSHNSYRKRIRELDQFGLTSLRTVPVIHTNDSYGVVLQHKQGWKLVYSGDTRPCGKLVKAGKNATLLIHEATFTQDLEDKAKIFKHSTMDEAMQVSRDMGAKFTILTHFSARYDLTSLAIPRGDNTGIAFDCMTVTLRDLHTLPPLLSTVQNVFSLMNSPSSLGDD